MKLRDSWYRPEGAPVLESVCIWCLRQASLCIIVDPCADREQYEDEAASSMARTSDYLT